MKEKTKNTLKAFNTIVSIFLAMLVALCAEAITIKTVFYAAGLTVLTLVVSFGLYVLYYWLKEKNKEQREEE